MKKGFSPFAVFGNVHLRIQPLKIKYILTFLKIDIMQAGIDTQEIM